MRLNYFVTGQVGQKMTPFLRFHNYWIEIHFRFENISFSSKIYMSFERNIELVNIDAKVIETFIKFVLSSKQRIIEILIEM